MFIFMLKRNEFGEEEFVKNHFTNFKYLRNLLKLSTVVSTFQLQKKKKNKKRFHVISCF